MPTLVHDLLLEAARQKPQAPALKFKSDVLTFAELADLVTSAAAGLAGLGAERHQRVAVYLPKQVETVAAFLASSVCGAALVPVNSVLKADQVGHILRDCSVRVLVTSATRLDALASILPACPALRWIVLVGVQESSSVPDIGLLSWQELIASGSLGPRKIIDQDVAAVLYTSGSTGKPKGVILSHRNIVTGAVSVAEYLEINSDDRLLAVPPFSFDYGLNQLMTCLLRGACCVLMDYLLPRDVLTTLAKERITGLAAVPPLWAQLAQLQWPAEISDHLRYMTNSGGKLPKAILDRLRGAVPGVRFFLMYGLTEAFRSTFLPPEEIDRRPDSIGKAIPNAEILVVREDGSLCAPHEPGELVHRGSLVALGYWNDSEKTAGRFRPCPGQPVALPITEMAVWSGDTVTMDEEGYLYFVGRRDDMIKTSGYRVSPTEVEEVLYSSGQVGEAIAIGVPHPLLGQAIVAVVTRPDGQEIDTGKLLSVCKERLPAYMVPLAVEVAASLPRNPNGKIDRKALVQRFSHFFEERTE